MDEIGEHLSDGLYVRDPSRRPWKFRPEGYLVVILSDANEAQRAESSLVIHGFATRDVKLYTGKQILESHEVYLGRRNVTDKVVGSVVDDSEGKKRYLAYAGDDRCAMWVRIPDEEDVPNTFRPRRTEYIVPATYRSRIFQHGTPYCCWISSRTSHSPSAGSGSKLCETLGQDAVSGLVNLLLNANAVRGSRFPV